jgi:hypothetical protein
LRGEDRGERDARVVGRPTDDDVISVTRGSEVLFRDTRVALQRAWSETTCLLQSMRDNPESARQEYDRVLDACDPGISPVVAFDPSAVSFEQLLKLIILDWPVLKFPHASSCLDRFEQFHDGTPFFYAADAVFGLVLIL